jgi:ATP-dependent DNA helicase RecQ
VCFELLPFVYDHKLGRVGTQTRSLVLVLSPLISLMVNRVTNLKLHGVSTAIMFGSDKISKRLQATKMDLKNCSLLFSVPEVVLGHKWRDSIENPDVADKIVAIVIDKAHCVSKW